MLTTLENKTIKALFDHKTKDEQLLLLNQLIGIAKPEVIENLEISYEVRASARFHTILNYQLELLVEGNDYDSSTWIKIVTIPRTIYYIVIHQIDLIYLYTDKTSYPLSIKLKNLLDVLKPKLSSTDYNELKKFFNLPS